MELVLAPKTKRRSADACGEPTVHPKVAAGAAHDLARVARALADPIRIQLLDVLREHAGEVCVCELVPLFEVSQPTVSHHLKVLREAGLVGSHKRGLWAYYYVVPGAMAGLREWLG